jgi:hypothetical protein
LASPRLPSNPWCVEDETDVIWALTYNFKYADVGSAGTLNRLKRNDKRKDTRRVGNGKGKQPQQKKGRQSRKASSNASQDSSGSSENLLLISPADNQSSVPNIDWQGLTISAPKPPFAASRPSSVLSRGGKSSSQQNCSNGFKMQDSTLQHIFVDSSGQQLYATANGIYMNSASGVPPQGYHSSQDMSPSYINTSHHQMSVAPTYSSQIQQQSSEAQLQLSCGGSSSGVHSYKRLGGAAAFSGSIASGAEWDGRVYIEEEFRQ